MDSKSSILAGLFVAGVAITLQAQAADFNGHYTENFDSMGTAGTAAPAGWSFYGNLGGGSGTWTSSVAAADAGLGTLNATLAASTSTSVSSNTAGYNYAASTSTGDRCLGTSPTSGRGVAWQLSLTNTTGAALPAIAIRYDTRRFTAPSSANELPGHWLFLSLDGGTSWTNASSLNPSITTVPNSTGTSVLFENNLMLATPWANGGTLLLRWIDDNAGQSSPDQIIGIDNVSIAKPATAPLDSALTLNTNQWAGMGAAAALGATNLTLECWFHKTGAGTTTSTGTGGITAVPLIAKGRSQADGDNRDCNYFLGINAAGQLTADFEQAAATSNGGNNYAAGQNFPVVGSTVLSDNTPYHVAATYDVTAGQWKLYVNGVAETLTVPAGSPATFAGVSPRGDSIQHFAIGTAMNSTGSAAGSFQGMIDEVRVWNIVRTAQEILAEKDNQLSSPVTGLIGRYGFDEGTGSALAGVPGTAPAGTLAATPLWSAGAPFGSLPIIRTLVSKGASWSYLDDGSNQGTAWKESGFDDSNWSTGTAPLGGGDTHIVTNLNLGTSGNRHITTYFRRSFEVAGAAAVQSIDLNILRDDGAVVYINGTEVARQNLPAGPINHLTNTPATVSGADETTYFPTSVASLPLLVNGINTIAVEVHQRDADSSDLGFDLELITESTPSTPPVVALTSPAEGAGFTAPGSISMVADASDDGSVTKVEFFQGSSKIGEDDEAPFEFTWEGVAQGAYSLTAKATDDFGLSTTSAPVDITVAPPVTAHPTVSITSPADGADFIAGVPILIEASASDPDGSVAKVEFFDGETKLGEDETEPFGITWSGASLGSHILTAVATDNLTATGTSAAITVDIVPNQAPSISLASPADNATNTGTAGTVTLEAAVSDPENQPLAVTFYGRNKAPAPGPDFTLVTIPDTQFYSQNTGGTRLANFTSQTNWIVSSKITLNTAFVAHMGDMVQDGDAIEQQWINADSAMDIIENPLTTLLTHGIPWGGAPGNHDQQPIGSPDGASTFWNTYFGTSRWAGRPYWGGNLSTNNDNNYQLFSASGLDFIVINLEYRPSANQDVLDWADALLKAHPNRRAIVTSHWLIGTGNPAAWGGHGQAVYDNLKDNPNLFLMLCGHIHGEGQRADIFEGRTVRTVLQDYQSRANGGDSWLRYFVFSPANNTISAKTYQTTTGTFETDSDSEFTIPYDMGGPGPWTELGTVSASGGTAMLEWTGLAPDSDYEWYAAVSDGTSSLGSTTRGFSTSTNLAPSVSLETPLDGATIAKPASVNFTATAADIDGSVAKVEFFHAATKLGEDTDSPYEFSWNPPSGSYAVSARATDNQGAITDSAVANITVTNPNNIAPIVAITQPTDGASVPGGTVNLTATAADNDGIVANVEFFEGATKLGEDDTEPYEFVWPAVSPGAYTLTAVATDNDAGTTTSSAVSITVLAVTDNTFRDGTDGYAGTVDTDIRSDSASQGIAYGSNPDMSIDGDDGDPGNAPNHGLIRFENIIGTAVTQIPAGSTINSATLRFTVSNAGSGLNVHRMLAAWDESSTWTSMVGGIQTDGSDAESEVIATVGANDGNENVLVGTLNLNVTAAVQAWADGSTNNGLALIPFPNGTNGIDVRSSEYTVAAERPALIVNFTAPPLPVLTIAATDASAGEAGADQALAFTVTRSGSTTASLEIPLVASGSASPGGDYSGFMSPLTIPIGQASATLPLTVQTDALAEGAETVTLALGSSAAFTAGSPASADATIADKPEQGFYFANIADPAKRAPTDDADGDSSANVIEYYMGTLPGDGNSRGVLEIPSTATNTFKVRYPRAKNRADVSGSLQWTGNLTGWFASGQSNGTHTVTFVETVVSPPEADPEIIEATATITGAGGAPAIFVRLGVQ